jgi:hypothetical protein
MAMSKYNVFETYAALMAEKDLLKKLTKTAADKRNSSKKDIKELNELYNLKPETSKDMGYERNIAEVAHPSSAYVGQSYDRINSLVENVNEGQNITINILRQKTTGLSNIKRYAEEELGFALVRIANALDGKDEDLCVLADTCLEQLHSKSMKKEAFGPLAIAGAVVVAGALIYLKEHADLADSGFINDVDSLMSDIDDVITSGTGFMSLRSEYKDSLKADLSKVNEHLAALKNSYMKIDASLELLDLPLTNDPAHASQTIKQVESDPSFQQNYLDFKKMVASTEIELDTLKSSFSDSFFKTRQIKDQGFGETVNNIFGDHIWGGKESLISDAFNDVVRQIPRLEKSVKSIQSVLDEAESHGRAVELDAKKRTDEAPQPHNPHPKNLLLKE